MKKTFIFEMKRLFLPACIYLGFMTILGALYLFSFAYLPRYCYTNLFSVFMFILILGLVILSFSYNKKRISADMTYSLPVTKRQLLFGKYLANLTYIVGLGLVYFIIVLILLAMTKNKVDLQKMTIENIIAGCFILMGLAIPLYNFMLLFYYKANTTFDGIVFMILGTVIPLLFVISIKFLISEDTVGSSPVDFYFSIVEIAFERMTVCNKTLLIVYSVLGTLLSGYFYWFSKKDCSIRTNEKSDGIFGYKVLLPLLDCAIVVFILVICGVTEFRIEYFFLITLGMFLFYGIYHRSPKFSKNSYITFGVITGINFLFALIYMLN